MPLFNSLSRCAGLLGCLLSLAHAGTAFAEESKPWQPKGATGVMVRTLVDVARGGFPGV